MISCRSGFPPFTLSLQHNLNMANPPACLTDGTHYGRAFQDWGAPIEDKDRLDSVKQKLVDPSQKACSEH